MKTIFKAIVFFVSIHLFFALCLLILDDLHGINDQDFSFVPAILFYYANYTGWWLITKLGMEFSVALLTLTALPQWILAGLVVGGIFAPFNKK